MPSLFVIIFSLIVIILILNFLDPPNSGLRCLA